jgi:ribosomal protein L34E
MILATQKVKLSKGGNIMQNLDTYQERYRKRLNRRRLIIGVQCLVVLLIVSVFVADYQMKRKHITCPTLQAQKSHVRLTDKQWVYSKFFQRNGSKVPDVMAVAITAVKKKNQKHLAKIAVIETNGNPKLRKYGYRKAHDGAFGVNRRDWGTVSHNAIAQALQAEFALEEFVKMTKGDLQKAKRLYGGERIMNTYNKKLDRVLLAELVGVP